jgi:glutamate synthase domain-containing protein 3
VDRTPYRLSFVLTGEQALKLMLLGADRVGFGTSLLMSLGCSMPARPEERDDAEQRRLFAPTRRVAEEEAAQRAAAGEDVEVKGALTNVDRCVGVGAAGILARRFGDGGLPKGRLVLRHRGAAGHFYGAYAVHGMELYLQGLAADSCFTAAYGGKLVVVPGGADTSLTVVGNTFAYGARTGRAYIAGRGGNRFGICLRRSHEGEGPRVVVEGVEANAFQYMTGGVALVLGPIGFNLGAGLTGGRVYLLEPDRTHLNAQYVRAEPLDDEGAAEVQQLLREHCAETASRTAAGLLRSFDPARFARVTTAIAPEAIE